MKKQNFKTKLAFKTTTISAVSNLNRIHGGANVVVIRFTENPPCIISDMNTCKTVTDPIKITEQLRCTHTIGNGLDIDGNPCAY